MMMVSLPWVTPQASTAWMSAPAVPQSCWLLLRPSLAHQEVYRVKDQNGELYATVGCLLGVAVPACSLPGFWDRLR